jgi:hypothetical protein
LRLLIDNHFVIDVLVLVAEGATGWRFKGQSARRCGDIMRLVAARQGAPRETPR